MRYTYDGPVYNPIKKVSLGDIRQSIDAVSSKQALSRINYLIKKKLGWDPTRTKIELDPKYLYSELDLISLNVNKKIRKKCSECGTELLDNGDCPRCNSIEYPDYFD